MDKVDAAAPGGVLRVIYERMVDDPESELRRLCEHIGIEFEPAMLDFHANKRIVRTISAEQVRRPLNRDASTNGAALNNGSPAEGCAWRRGDRWNDDQKEE
jgi:hypothetical protein